MKLIADSGSTKATWCYINETGERGFFQTEGYNPCFVDSQYIIQSICNFIPSELNKDEVNEINFYGAGCYSENIIIIEEAIRNLFKNASIYVGLDLLAAARALLFNKPGFAAILGTGTNTCLYNGHQISSNIDSLGYILGDEGSGTHIGKQFLSSYARGYLPENLRKLFWNKFKLNTYDIIEHMYSKPLANRFCSGFCQFIYDNIENEFLYNLVKGCFTDLFKNLIIHYDNYNNYSFNCIGSVGFAFKDILVEVANDYNMKTGQILKSPIENLVTYHQKLIMKEI